MSKLRDFALLIKSAGKHDKKVMLCTFWSVILRFKEPEEQIVPD